ncbi:MAG: lysylphosphatidylglycerol synthase domain-containing protein [Kiritimatiellia bacterium]
MKMALRFAVSAAVSAGILWLVFREAGSSAGEVLQALGAMGLGVWAAYAAAQLLQGWLRAVRYRLLLAGAGAAPLPGRGRMFGVTLARNMFVDMLPARFGELAYWALLNRGEKVKSADCVSSMTVSVLFDFLALAVVLAFAVAAPVAEAGGRVALLWGAGVVLVAVAVGGVALFRGPAWAAALARRLPGRAKGWRWLLAWMEKFMDNVSDSFGQLRGAGVLGKAAALSVGIRAVKYLGLAAAFYGVARTLRPALAELPTWQTLVGLIGGEGGAALPMPTFLSLGSYEAAGAGAMRLSGVSGADAAIVLLGTHVASQIVDYSLGGLGLLGLLWGRRPPAAGGASPARSGRAKAGWIAGIGLLAALAFLGGVFGWRAQQKAGAKDAPGSGETLQMGAAEKAALAGAWGGRHGFVVWSSTMFGQHDLVRMDWPSGNLKRLTEHPHVDSMPKISPDGTRVAFTRSRREWVSFRNLDEWDVWLLDLRTGQERRLAEWGTEPGWTGDGKAVAFQRGGREVVRADAETGAETVLLGPREGTVWTGPSIDPAGGGRLAATIRGRRRSTSLVAVPDGAETRVAGGCQLAFVPGGSWLVLVEDGGRMKNRICRTERDGTGMQTLLDMPGEWSHEYFPRVSYDGGLLAFGAAREGHEHDTADYEIFLWRIGTPPETAARMSFHTGNDQWPDVWVDSGVP